MVGTYLTGFLLRSSKKNISDGSNAVLLPFVVHLMPQLPRIIVSNDLNVVCDENIPVTYSSRYFPFEIKLVDVMLLSVIAGFIYNF